MITLKHSLRGWGWVLRIAPGLFTLLLGTQPVQAQSRTDTLSLTLKQTERIFLEKNLELLAQHYNIEASKALVQQARLWDDPTLTTDQNVYSNNKWFEHGTNPDGTPKGQFFVQVQQLIKTAGKRGKQISMAQTGVNISQWRFTELMQHLKFQLRSDFHTLVQLQAVQDLYTEQDRQLDQLLAGMTGQFSAGNIARKDLLRVQALQVNLKQQMADNLKQIEDSQSELKTLLQITGDTVLHPIPEVQSGQLRPSLNVASLVDTAKENNATYQLGQLQVQYQRQNLAFQKALAVPDVTVGPSYDHNSNYTPHYVGLGLSLPLPILNGNRGNIKAARWQVKQEETNLSQADVRLQNDVASAYKKYQYTLQLQTGAHQDFYADYKKLQENIAESFRQRQISLLEFIDYFNDYEEVRTKQLQLQLDTQLAKEELNLQLGADIF
ncbi:TolC family protein [Taibaiella koreensis]|uniref:TolC family protein n=1 Tax=Taibaiella koreensis TaxID=1268548 RepID=UPI000E599950|nr:TolC family protein [Taibaiella koreensis]